MKFNNTNKGFSLLESMIAIGILLVAVVAPLSTIGDSLAQIYVARDQMVAINLAQEGIEAVRQVRDSNMIKGWREGSPRNTLWNAGGLDTQGFYSVDLSETPTLTTGSAQGDSLKQDVTTGVYGNSGTETKFRRVVFIEPISGSPDETKITSTILWKTAGGTDKKIEVSESLFGINTTP